MTAITKATDADTILGLIATGDVSRLSPEQKAQYYKMRCEAAGLDPVNTPFAYIKLQGKEVLYALKGATDQLASKHGVILSILEQRTEQDIRVVTVRATARDGRQTEEIGALNIKGLTGEPLANALMKAVTKAKRRAILSLTGMGMLDETEIESIPHAKPVTPAAKLVEAVVQQEAPADIPEAEVFSEKPPPAETVISPPLDIDKANAARLARIKALKDSHGAEMGKFCEKVLGRAVKNSRELSLEDIDKLEAADAVPF